MADIIDKSIEGLDNFLADLGSTAERYLQLEKIIPNVIDLFVDQSAELKKLSKELGNGSKLTADLRGQYASLSRQIGISSKEITNLLSVTKSYHQGIKDSTSSTLQFIKASGASVDIVGKLSARLNILGKASSKTFDAMYENILSVRDAYGLTSDQIEQIIDIVDRYAVITQASNTQIEQSATLLAKFTSQLTSAGMEAQRVGDLLNSMIDPNQLTDNIALMAKLGISVSDMVSGDPVAKLEGSTEKLKQLGQEISNIAKTNRIQANEVAKVYSLTLEEANMLANLDTSEKVLDTQKKLEQYRNEMATFADGVAALKNTITGAIAGPLSKLGGILEDFGNTLGLLPKGLITVGMALTGKLLINKLREGLGQAAKYFSESFEKYLGQAQLRVNRKASDASALKSKTSKSKIGFGYNFAANQEERAQERSLNNFIKGRRGKSTFLDAGEMLERMQEQQARLRSKQIEINAMPEGFRKDFLSLKYGGIQHQLNEYDSFMQEFGSKKLFRQFDKNDDFLKQQNIFSRSKGAAAESSGRNLIDMAKKSVGLNLGGIDFKNMNGDAIKSLAAILSQGDVKGPKDVLEAFKEFFTNRDDIEGAADAIKEITGNIKEMNNEVTSNVEAMDRSRALVKGMSDAERGKGFVKGGVGAIGQSAGVFMRNVAGTIIDKFKDIGEGAKRLFFSMPEKLLSGVGKVLKLGGLGLLAGFGAKLMSSIAKNEKFQEGIKNISEKISGIFDTLVKAAEPIVEPAVKLITWILEKIQPFIDWIANGISKLTSWIGGKVSKSLDNISGAVSTIEDSYKKEDLRTMALAAGSYNTENDEIVALLKDTLYKIDGISKNQKENTTVLMMKQAN